MFTTVHEATARLQACIPIDSLTPAQARVEVAKDVLAAIRIGKIKAGTGIDYVVLNVNDERDPLVEGESLRDLLVHMEGPATVCGIGALMIAHVARFNRYHLTRWNVDSSTRIDVDKDDIYTHLAAVFTVPMLRDIEAVYEVWPEDLPPRVMSHILKKYPGKGRGGKTARLEAIMLDIINNEGTFDPRRLTE